MEASQKEGLQKQLELLKRQESGLKTLQSSLTQGTNLFQEQEDEFGYQSTFNTYLSQAQDIDLGVAKTNTEVNNQAAMRVIPVLLLITRLVNCRLRSQSMRRSLKLLPIMKRLYLKAILIRQP